MRYWLRTPIAAILVHLQLGWNSYLLFISDIVNVVWKTDKGGEKGTERIVLLIFVIWRCFNEGLWVGVESLI